MGGPFCFPPREDPRLRMSADKTLQALLRFWEMRMYVKW